MVGVAVFALGVLTLGESVNNCLTSELANAEDQRARLALQNRMAEVESGAVHITDGTTEELKGMFSGITIKQNRKALGAKNENDQDLPGLIRIDLEALWTAGTQPQSKLIFFYVYNPG